MAFAIILSQAFSVEGHVGNASEGRQQWRGWRATGGVGEGPVVPASEDDGTSTSRPGSLGPVGEETQGRAQGLWRAGVFAPSCKRTKPSPEAKVEWLAAQSPEGAPPFPPGKGGYDIVRTDGDALLNDEGSLALDPLSLALSRRERENEPLHAASPAKPWKSIFPVLNAADIEERHRQIAEEALLAMPEQCRWALKNFFVRYDGSVERALGGKSTIILNGTVPDEEFRALFIHEFGHVTDLGCIRGTPGSAASAFHDGPDVMTADDPSVDFYAISWATEKKKRKGSRATDFVSGYAAWDAHEDFAETFAYYVLQREAFRARAERNTALAKKFQWMEENVFGDAAAVAQGEAPITGIPWDVTLLPYTW